MLRTLCLFPRLRVARAPFFSAINASASVLQNPGYPSEALTPEARVRSWVFSAGACSLLGFFSAFATWYLASLHIEGMGGIVAYLALLCWLGGGGFGFLGGVVAACMAEGEGQKVSFYIIGFNVALLVAAYLFLAYK
jgi:hypothetical protein